MNDYVEALVPELLLDDDVNYLKNIPLQFVGVYYIVFISI